MSEISRADVEHLASLAHLSMSEAEQEKMVGELAVIIDSVRAIQQVTTDDVPATSHPIALRNVFRRDEVGEVLSAEQALANAPDAESDRFKVPAILDQE